MLASCQLFTGDCTTAGRPALVIRVTDAETGDPPEGESKITITDGTWTEVHEGLPDPILGQYAAAFERPGTYSVLIETPGYQNWNREGVIVRRTGSCDHLATVSLTAAIAPLSNSSARY